MEFESDDDVDEQVKNSSDAKMEGKVQVRKKTVHYYEIVVTKRKESTLTQKNQENPRWPRKSTKNDENDHALVSNEMTLLSIGNDIFIGGSAATSHMTINKTRVYDLILIRGSITKASAVPTKASWMLFANTKMDQQLDRHGR